MFSLADLQSMKYFIRLCANILFHVNISFQIQQWPGK